MGLQVNPAKEEIGQTLTLLGVKLSTVAQGGDQCSAAMTDEKRAHVRERCNFFIQTDSTSLKELEKFVGLLAFCAQVILGAGLYLRSGYSLIHSAKASNRSRVYVSKGFKADCAHWKKLVAFSGSCGTLLNRRPLSPLQFAWDASLNWGIGGFFQGNHFSIPWSDLTDGTVNMPDTPKKGTPTWHINYMETFAAFVAIARWGKHLRGCTIICKTDNTSAQKWVGNLSGPAHTIPLLKRIHDMLVRYDIRIVPDWLSSEANIIPDTLSRGDMPGFYIALQQWKDDGGVTIHLPRDT
jgi:hypothetical protein